MNTIFTKLSLDPHKCYWAKHLMRHTPFELHEGVWFKREDKFAPLGYGGPNGSKLRQLIYLFSQNVGHGKLVTGASVKSPQLSMSAIVANHFGQSVHQVIGATKPETALKHPNVNIAARFGAKFEIIKVGYNPALQSRVGELAKAPDTWQLEYGITLNHDRHPAQHVADFHAIGAEQVANMPADIETLIMPAGSCNSLVSVLYGIAKYRPHLKNLKTYGIGPDRMEWVHTRCKLIEAVTGLDITSRFQRLWPQYKDLAEKYTTGVDQSCLWMHHNLQDDGFCDYQMEMKESWGDIVLHPTYEGKIMRWLKTHGRIRQDEKTAFWIVGSAPDFSRFSQFATEDEMKTLPLEVL